MVPIFTVPSYTVFAYTQNLSSQVVELFVPLDLGNHLKIKCFNGSFVEFLSEWYFAQGMQIVTRLRKQYFRMYSEFKIWNY